MSSGPRLSPEEEEALRQMQEEVSSQLPDRRSEGDSSWLANGAQVELHGLQKAQTLNGQRGEIVGFDDKQLRYRVRLHSDNSVKVVAKKNLRLLTYQDLQLPAAEPPLSSRASGSGTPGAGAVQTPQTDITREMALRAVERLKRDCHALQQRIAVRRGGGGSEATPDICDVFLRLAAAEEMCKEVITMYQAAKGRDQELQALGDAAMEMCEATVQDYQEVRSWQEYFQDEVNVTKYSVKKHGILGTLKNEVVEVGQDVADIGRGASEVIRTGSTQVPGLVRAATGTVNNVVQTGTAAAASTAGTFATRGQQQLTTALHDSVVSPVKRAWHLLVFGFFLCFLVPLFALRSYAPFNTVVSNLGVLYLAVCTCCPPRGMHHRAAKAALILLYPLVTVALPIGLQYYATHPNLSQDMQDVGASLRRLPASVTRSVQQLGERVGERFEPGRAPKSIPQPLPAPPPPAPPAPEAPAPAAPAPAAPAPEAPAAPPAPPEPKEDTAPETRKGPVWWLRWLLSRFRKPALRGSLPDGADAFVMPVRYTGRLATTAHPRLRRRSLRVQGKKKMGPAEPKAAKPVDDGFDMFG